MTARAWLLILAACAVAETDPARDELAFRGGGQRVIPGSAAKEGITKSAGADVRTWNTGSGYAQTGYAVPGFLFIPLVLEAGERVTIATTVEYVHASAPGATIILSSVGADGTLAHVVTRPIADVVGVQTVELVRDFRVQPGTGYTVFVDFGKPTAGWKNVYNTTIDWTRH